MLFLSSLVEGDIAIKLLFVMYQKINIALVTLLAFGAFSASADTRNLVAIVPAMEQNDTRPVPRPTAEARKEINEARKEVRMDAKATLASTTAARENMRGDIKNLRASTTEARGDMRDDMKNRRASTTEARGQMRDGFKEKRLEIAKKHAELVGARLDAAIARVQKLADRVGMSLDKLTTQGINVAVARAKLADAKVKLDAARVKVAQVKTATLAALASEAPREEMKKVEALVKEAIKSIQGAHRSVAEAIASVKPGVNKLRATTTPTSTATSTSNQ